MKKMFFVIAVYFSLALPSFGFGSIITEPQSCTNSEVVVTSGLLSTLMEDDLLQSQTMLAMSQNLSTASQNINSVGGINNEYIMAMLRLSDDIGTMADRIGTMADRIVQTEVLIGDMADRIVEVAQMIINNNAQTQLNILTAQQNFNDLLTQLQ